jgi:hypothetical protein
MLKDLTKFPKFKYGRVVMMLYWVGQPTCQGVFPKKTLSRPYSEYEMDGGKTFGTGALDISRVHIVSFMGAFMEGVLHPSFATFFQCLYLCFIYYGLNIECYVQVKKISIVMLLEFKIQ